MKGLRTAGCASPCLLSSTSHQSKRSFPNRIVRQPALNIGLLDIVRPIVEVILLLMTILGKVVILRNPIVDAVPVVTQALHLLVITHLFVVLKDVR